MVRRATDQPISPSTALLTGASTRVTSLNKVRVLWLKSMLLKMEFSSCFRIDWCLEDLCSFSRVISEIGLSRSSSRVLPSGELSFSSNFEFGMQVYISFSKVISGMLVLRGKGEKGEIVIEELKISNKVELSMKELSSISIEISEIEELVRISFKVILEVGL